MLGFHALGVICAGLAGRRSMRTALLVAAVAPAAATIWVTMELLRGGTTEIVDITWVSGLNLNFTFMSSPLALVMVLLIAGIGTAVFVYASGYFDHHAAGATRFPATLLAFSTSMLGLALADSLWTLFIFWELTTITSFLLVGHKNIDPAVRAAARRALMITGGGGLALLAGLLVLAREAGTSRLSELGPVSGTAASVAAVLIMLGAATKSAQVPFHVWLPGAMAAPTPVSAYLHSATMVKAGVLLVSVIGPSFPDVGAWKSMGLSFGVTSMLWGAIGALRQRDAKLILAWGTVSQLGLLITLLSLGTAKATFAAISLLFAHALFKAALFLIVGEVDIRTGTRSIDDLGGLHHSMPVAFIVAVAAALSMMGAPPLLGFMAKEAAIEAALGLDGIERAIVMPAIVGGSTLTVAYTVRFLIGVFGPGPATDVAPRRLAMTAPAVLLSSLGLVGYFAAGVVNDLVIPAATQLNAGSDAYALIRWPGLKLAFVISVAVLVVGSALGAWLVRRTDPAPRPIGATAADNTIESVLAAAPRLTATIQHGSLPVYLATMATAATVAAVPFVSDLGFGHLVLWDHPVQGVLSVAIVVAAIAGGFVGSRLGAALALGAVGTGMSGLFVLQGAPDLALTQLLVETVIVVGFVIGLGHLTNRFPDASDSWKTVRGVLAVAGGLAVPAALIASGAEPAGTAPVDELTRASVDEGGGNNVVNVILTDMRALDTLGEVVVLATVAVGILSLARNRTAEANA